MKVDSMMATTVSGTREDAQRMEAEGFDGLWVEEARHDPFLQLLQVAEATENVSVGSSIAVAFARTPMSLAYAGYDLSRYSKGRFIMGLGSQVKPHIEKRFSMPWSHPAARMREMVLAMRAIWRSWQSGDRLEFEGEFYTHTLMNEWYAPEPQDFGPPQVYLAGIGKVMTEVAGEVGDGFIFHPFTTNRYLDETTVPALRRGRSRAGRDGLDGFVVSGAAFACIGKNDRELAKAIRTVKEQIAFYASTPSYRSVLEQHGWADLQPEMNELLRQGRYSDMAALVDDCILAAFAVAGSPSEVARELKHRYSGVAQRITPYMPYDVHADAMVEFLHAMHS